MKLLLALSALVTLAATQSISEVLFSLPKCAQTCMVPVIFSLPCNITTLPALAACLCTNITAQRTSTSCLQKGCNVTEQYIVAGVQTQLCADFPIPSRSGELQSTAIILLALSMPVVLLRVCSRVFIASKLWWDDWAVLLSSVMLVTTLVLEILSSQIGFGKHIWNVNPIHAPALAQYFYSTQILYIGVQVLTKISLLIFYLRVFPQNWLRRATYASIALILTHGIIFIFVVAFQCTPVRSVWDKSIESTCLNQVAIIYVGSGFSIAEDFLIIALPIPCINSLHLGRGKRINLLIMFSVGSFACIASMVRLKHLIGFGDFTDSTWDNMDITIWSCIEIGVAVICACLPALRPLVSRALPKIFGSVQSTSGTPLDPSRAPSRPDTKGMHRVEDSESLEIPQKDNENASSIGGRWSDGDDTELVAMSPKTIPEKSLPRLPT